MVIAQDITARRKAEAGANQLAAIVNSSQESTVGWNWDKQVTSWNPGAERLYGWTEQEMLARSILELMPEERQADAEAVCAMLRASQSIDLLDTSRRHKSGRLLKVWVSTSPILNAVGEVVGASTISRDIAEQNWS